MNERILQLAEQAEKPAPDCKLDCRFSYGMTMTTATYYPPIYDKHGNNTNPDGNTTTGSVKCLVCNKEWNYFTQYGQTIFQKA